MKRIFHHIALVFLALGLTASPSAAQDLFWTGGVGLSVEDVYVPSNDPIEIRLTFWQSMDAESFDHEDLWIVGENGFQQLATFIRLERGPSILPPPLEENEDGLRPPDFEDPDPDPDRRAPTVALYHVLPSDLGWNGGDNGRYVVLLQPNQIALTGGGTLNADYLGDFHIGIGLPIPAIPEEVEMTIRETEDGTYTASVVYHYSQGPIEVIDWGTPVRTGQPLNIDFQAVFPSDAFTDAPVALERDYNIPPLEPGTYHLSVTSRGHMLNSQRFTVRGEAPIEIPASAELTITQDDETVVGHVTVSIQPNEDGSIYHIGDWGEPRQDGNTIYLDATSNGPLESFNTEPYEAAHEYLLHGDERDDDEGRPVGFRELELVPSYLRPTEPEQHVFRTEEEWSNWVRDHWPPLILAALPPVPVDFDEFTVLAVFGGEVDQGIDVSITAVTDYGTSIVADYLTSYPGILPEDPQQIRPGSMVAIPKTKLPIRFRGDIIAFPSPPPVDPIPFDIAAQELEVGDYRVIFRIDGVAYAKGEFRIGDDNDRIPARATIDISEGNDSALVEVAFTGFPYHTVSDWGPVTRRGNHFILDAETSEVNFVQEPELPYVESHVYPLNLVTGSTEIDFERIDLSLQKIHPQNVIIQSRQEWWDLIGFEPGPLVLPAPDPVNFDEVTLIIVFAGAKPNGCYDVKIHSVTLDHGVINVAYRERLPSPLEFCTEAIVYPVSAIALEKTSTPIDFIESPAQIGGDEDPIPVDGPPGDGSDADPLPEPGVEAPSILSHGQLYTVEFRMNGVTYATTRFYGNNFTAIPRPLPLPFVDWLDRFLPQLPAEGGALNDAGQRLDENEDGDRWTNFEEFLLGLDPTTGSEPSAIWTDWITDEEGQEHFAICYKRRKDAGDHADFIVETSQDLILWSHRPDFILEPIIRSISADLEEVTVCLAPEAAAAGFPFARLAVREK